METSRRRLSERHAIEESFHDEAARRGEDDFWSFAALDGPDAYHWQTMGDLRGKRVLEIGCGNGTITEKLARSGAIVTAIDISNEMVELTRRRCARLSVEVLHKSAEELDCPRASFDVIYGHSVLHHLDHEVVVPAFKRMLRPGGVATFLDPLAGNPILNLMRSLTPDMRTPTEKPISEKEIKRMSQEFAVLRRREFHLTSLGAYFWYYGIRSRTMFRTTLNALVPIDRALFAMLPVLRRYAWVTVLTLKA